MRTILTLTCCVGLAVSVSANQQNNNNQQYKKKGGNAPQQAAVAPQGNKFKTGTGYKQNFQQQNSVGNPNKFKYQNQSSLNNSQKFNSNKFNANKFNSNKFKNQSNINNSASSTTFNKTKN